MKFGPVVQEEMLFKGISYLELWQPLCSVDWNHNSKIMFKPKNPNQKYFLKFVYVFINAVIGWNSNILNFVCQITFPSSSLSDRDQCLSVEHKAMYIQM